MAQRRYRPSYALVLAVIASLMVFVFDPKVVTRHVWAYYLLPFAVVAVWGRRREVYAISVLLCLMIVGMLWFKPAPPPGHIANFHLLPLAVLWALAWVSEQRLQTQERLEQQVQARTAELQTSEEHYRLLSENATDVVWALDLEGKPTYFSPSVAHLRGYSVAEELAMMWDERVATGFNPQGDAEGKAIPAALQAGESHVPGLYVVEHRNKHGETIWIESSVGPLYAGDGRLAGLRGTSRDVTRRHLAEEALHRSEDRLAKIFRSSPGAIAITRIADGLFVDANQAYEDLLGDSRDQLLGRTAAELGILPAATRAMLAAAAQVQTYVRGAETQCVAAAATGQGSKTAIRQQLVEIDVVPPGLTIESDPVAIAEVLKRLLDNASKFTPDGGKICLEAHTGPEQASGQNTVIIAVCHTGSGIDPEQLAWIRRPFTQLDAGLARRHEGIGLGLAYVDEMIRLLGGWLDIESTPGQGSRFMVTLPAQ